MKTQELKSTTHAGESAETTKSRKKLEKRLSCFDHEITKEALEKKIGEIRSRIDRADRVVVPSKSLALFDENQNTAKLSAKVKQIANLLKTQI